MDEIQECLENAKNSMEKAYACTQMELTKIRTGRALPNMLDGISVVHHGSLTPINQLASINTAGARVLVVKPWEKSLIFEIEKAISNSKLALAPKNDGEIIRLNIPPLTEERRKELVKKVKNEAERGKVIVRNVRKETKETLKKLQKIGQAEDIIKKGEEKIQKLTDTFTKKFEVLLAKKEIEIMEV